MLQLMKYNLKFKRIMKSYTHTYISEETLCSYIDLHQLCNEQSCLIQVFSGEIDRVFLEGLIGLLCKLLPHAHIIGATTDGEIGQKQVSLGETVLSFSVFENVVLRSGYAEGPDSYDNASRLFDKIGSEKTRLLIAFSDGMDSNGDEVLNGFGAKNENMIVAGGMAGDNAAFKVTYVMHQNRLLDQGLVGVAFESEALQVNTHYSFDWVPIGNEMLVTRAEGNRVYEVNGISAYEIFKRYLGENAARELPRVGVEFPFIIQEDGINIARAIMRTHDDGSLSFAGNIPVGSKVRFGVGNPDLILQHGRENSQVVQEYPVEAVFIYSCMARRRFLQDNINAELELYPDKIPVSGFFTYGEFFSSAKQKRLLNQSMTILMLSEKSESLSLNPAEPAQMKISGGKEYMETLEALAHLVNVTSSELNSLNQNLEQRVEDKVKELEKSTKFFQKIFETSNDGIWVVDLNKDTIMANKALCTILGYSEDELIGTSIYNYVDEAGRKKIYKNSDATQKGEGGTQYEIELVQKNRHRVYCLFSSEALRDENDEIIGSFAIISDITKRKHAEEELVSFNCLLEERIAEEVLKNHSKDELMTKQMRLAQMGEMISMIAHQWRQPLSTISAIISSVQLDLSLRGEEEKPHFTDLEKVSEHIQFLSNTIDDFRHFFNPNKSKDQARLSALLDNALGIMNQSFLQKKIDVICDFDRLQRPLTLYASELVHVFLNLMKNALDALVETKKENAYVFIRGSQYENKSIIVFEDNAGGIPSDILDKIFEPYFTTKDERNGTGLGLYMSKMIVEEHCNGNLLVENTDVGARFSIVLDY